MSGIGMDIVRGMTTRQVAAAYDRGSITWAVYEAIIRERAEQRHRVASGKAPAVAACLLTGREDLDALTAAVRDYGMPAPAEALELRMTDRDETYD